jgi:predicted nucleic acid-binding Zn ribbon protein
MSYVKKTCPVCGKEFFVLKKAEEKAIYCTLACLTKAQNKLESRGVTFPGLG